MYSFGILWKKIITYCFTTVYNFIIEIKAQKASANFATKIVKAAYSVPVGPKTISLVTKNFKLKRDSQFSQQQISELLRLHALCRRKLGGGRIRVDGLTFDAV